MAQMISVGDGGGLNAGVYGTVASRAALTWPVSHI
jgi:hypothetical protein